MVTMLESKRTEMVEALSNEVESKLEEALSSDDLEGVFTKIETDSLLREASLYANKENYDSLGFSVFAAPILVGIVADRVQAYNLVDIEDRSCDLIIYDAESGDILYPTQ